MGASSNSTRVGEIILAVLEVDHGNGLDRHAFATSPSCRLFIGNYGLFQL